MANEVNTEGDIAVKWLRSDLKNALVNSPHPLSVAVGIMFGGVVKVIGLVEWQTVPALIANYRVPEGYVFGTWDGSEFKVGPAANFAV